MLIAFTQNGVDQAAVAVGTGSLAGLFVFAARRGPSEGRRQAAYLAALERTHRRVHQAPVPPPR